LRYRLRGIHGDDFAVAQDQAGGLAEGDRGAQSRKRGEERESLAEHGFSLRLVYSFSGLLRACDVSRVIVLPSGSPDTVGASDFGYFGAHNFGIPSLHAPLSNAASAGLPGALTWLGVRMVSLFLSCMTLAFTTPRRFSINVGQTLSSVNPSISAIVPKIG
jgi:hypothetical protein